MNIVWDPIKAKLNLLKHRIHFADAEMVLYDQHALSLPDSDSMDEERFIATGCDALGRILTIIYPLRTIFRV